MAVEMTAKAAAATPKPAKRAYVTILAGDGDDSWEGVVGLARSLRKFGPAYQLVVAVLPDVPEYRRHRLRSQGCVVREVEPVHPTEIQSAFAMEYYVAYYSKLRIWEFVEYERMVYLDARSEVLDNIDDLFEVDGHLHAARTCITDVFVLEPSMATADSMVRELRLSVTPPTNLFEKHNVACQQHLLRGGAGAGGDADVYRTASAGMGGFRWMTILGLLIAVVALNNFPVAAGSEGLTTALNFFLLALAVGGVNLINAGVCLTGRGRAESPACTSTTRYELSKVPAFARRNVTVLGVAGASSAATGVIIFAPDPVPCFVCFALFLLAMFLVTVGALASGTR